MNLVIALYAGILFLLLTPGVLVRLPPKGSFIAQAVVHAFIFAVVWHFTSKYVWKMTSGKMIKRPAYGPAKKIVTTRAPALTKAKVGKTTTFSGATTPILGH
jgi:hypothetical protein